MEPTVTPSLVRSSGHKPEQDPLRACVHCGLCLEECPTYRLSGNENNSPRGRLLLWRAESEGRIPADKWTDFYTDECVGCLACISVCPANVPYGHLLESARRRQVEQRRDLIRWPVALASKAVRSLAFFNFILAPARLLRRAGLLPHAMIFPGTPSLVQSTAAYARELTQRYQPSGPTVAFLTGCLMEALFREINFATVRVLIENNVRVIVPENQGCCGALHEHTGMPGAEELSGRNREAFSGLKIDRVVTNSGGCGFALSKSLKGVQHVQDVLAFLGEIGPVRRAIRSDRRRLYVDLPCHLIHGQGSDGIPTSVLDATGCAWELAPLARDCCGSGGVYNLQKPQNAREILRGKSAFLDALPNEIEPILVTSNHVCMMQWHSAHAFVKRRFQVSHVVQLLDPGVNIQPRTTSFNLPAKSS